MFGPVAPEHMPRDAGLYSFVAALAVKDVVGECLLKLTQNSQPDAPLPNPPREGEGTLALSRQDITLKWPNDVLVNGKKISGILLEVVDDALIVGIGLNIAHHPETALYPSTSLYAELTARQVVFPSPWGGVRGGVLGRVEPKVEDP